MISTDLDTKSDSIARHVSSGYADFFTAAGIDFEQGYADLREKHPKVLLEARQRGLMMGLKPAKPSFGPWMMVAGFQSGLLAIYANHDPSVLQVLPPPIIQEAEARQVLAILNCLLGGLERTFS